MGFPAPWLQCPTQHATVTMTIFNGLKKHTDHSCAASKLHFSYVCQQRLGSLFECVMCGVEHNMIERPSEQGVLRGSCAYSTYGRPFLPGGAHMLCAALDPWVAAVVHEQSCSRGVKHHTRAHGKVSCEARVFVTHLCAGHARQMTAQCWLTSNLFAE